MLTGEGFVAAVSVAVFRGDRVLVLRRAANADAAPGVWETVSGRIERGEDPLDTAQREVAEETAIEVEVHERPIDSYVAARGDQPMIVVVYRAEWRAGEVKRSDEHDEHAWLRIDELEARGVPARLVTAIEAAARASGAA